MSDFTGSPSSKRWIYKQIQCLSKSCYM